MFQSLFINGGFLIVVDFILIIYCTKNMKKELPTRTITNILKPDEIVVNYLGHNLFSLFGDTFCLNEN